MMRKFLISILAAVMLAMGFPTVAGAAEAPVSLDPDQVTQLRESFSEYGVDPQTQDRLIDKLSSGEVWDSFVEGAVPVSTESRETASARQRIDTYADGSIVVMSVEKPDSSALDTRAAWDCTFQSAGGYGGYWKNCNIYFDTLICMLGFYLDYQNIQGSGASITRYWGYYSRIVGGALDGHRLERIDSKTVRYSAEFSVAFKGFPAGWTVWIQANVDGNDLRLTYN